MGKINDTILLVFDLVFYRMQDNVFGKAKGRTPYCKTATTDNAVQKYYLAFYKLRSCLLTMSLRLWMRFEKLDSVVENGLISFRLSDVAPR
jgi:hypothetical protein